MLDNIKVGKRYRLDVRLTAEYVCSGCGRAHGSWMRENMNGRVALVVESPWVRGNVCVDCGHVLPPTEGIWGVVVDGETYNAERPCDGVPFTWLAPLPGEDYDDAVDDLPSFW